MKIDLRDAVFGVGFLAVSIGAYMIYWPAGLIVGGVILLALALDLLPRKGR